MNAPNKNKLARSSFFAKKRHKLFPVQDEHKIQIKVINKKNDIRYPKHYERTVFTEIIKLFKQIFQSEQVNRNVEVTDDTDIEYGKLGYQPECLNRYFLYIRSQDRIVPEKHYKNKCGFLVECNKH